MQSHNLEDNKNLQNHDILKSSINIHNFQMKHAVLLSYLEIKPKTTNAQWFYRGAVFHPFQNVK
jgi:hypothetical protein